MTPAVRLASTALAVGAAFGGAAVVGDAVGPIQTDERSRSERTLEVAVGGPSEVGDDERGEAVPDHAEHMEQPDQGQDEDQGGADEHAGHAGQDDSAEAGEDGGAHGDHGGAGATAGGVLISDAGYTLEPEATTLDGAAGAELRFRIRGPDGEVVHDFDLRHERELHLVVAGRDLSSYAHVHPLREGDGTWSVELPALPTGSHRAFADFAVAGGPALTLSVDLQVPGAEPLPAVPEPGSVAFVDGYVVTMLGTPAAGGSAEMAFVVERDGVAVTDLEPYLGALGHLVALRAGDLAYIHAHPGEGDGTSGPTVPFDLGLPSQGTYRLFFEFSHGGKVHTADFTVPVAP